MVNNFYITQMKNIFIIGTYPDRKYKMEMLEECIDSIRFLGYDVMIVSHLPLTESILKKVDYFLYDKENKLISIESSPSWLFSTDSFSVKCTAIPGHALAVSKNITNGINFAKSLGYKFFFYCESDNLFSKGDLIKMEILKNEMFSKNKKGIFFSEVLEDRKILETIFFGGVVEYFHENISFPIDESDLEGTTISLERFMYRKYEKLIDNFLILKGHSKDYFSESKINFDFNKFLVGVFISNKPPYMYLFVRNHYENPSSIYVQINENPIKEYVPGYWSISGLENIESLNIKIQLDGEEYHKKFDLSEKLSLFENGFIHFHSVI